ncbi:MAG: YceI family protein [Bacteroidia bacterium]|nr:YceI family protein [Bacteroidia bacterium]
MTTKTQFKKAISVLLTFLSFIILSLDICYAQTEQLLVDLNHSNVSFSVPLAGGLTKITGKYTDFDITLNYVDTEITKSSVSAVIKTASINTGIAGRDEHLASPDFFDAEKYPQITFTSDSIVKTEKGYIAYGTFQLHGISKKNQLPFTITGKDAEGSIGFASSYVIKRSVYGLGDDAAKADASSFVGDDITVDIGFLVKKKKEKK